MACIKNGVSFFEIIANKQKKETILARIKRALYKCLRSFCQWFYLKENDSHEREAFYVKYPSDVFVAHAVKYPVEEFKDFV